MIHIEPLAQSRQVDLEVPNPVLKEKTPKVHRLGAALQTAQSLKESVRPLNQTTLRRVVSQQVFFTFSNSNPFYQMHKAMHYNPVKTSPTQKTFRDVIQEVHQMKEICEKLLSPEKQEEPQETYHKTLIMDLQKLQTNRVDLDKMQSSLHESKISIKGGLPEDMQFCLHGKCEEINGILENALLRLEELERENGRLEKCLVDQRLSKQVAEKENVHLREEIARIDEEKCEQIKKLRQELEKLKRKQENVEIQQKSSQSPPKKLQESRKVAIENLPTTKSIKQTGLNERPALVSIEVQSNLQESVLVPAEGNQELWEKPIMKKLKHVVYL